jgi:hypothetical protein
MEVVSGGIRKDRREADAPGSRADDRDLQGRIMTAAFTLMMIYRLLALFVAAMMIYVIWRERDWRPQFYAALVFVPFILRGLGVK